MLLLVHFIKIWSRISLLSILLIGSIHAQTDTCRLYDAHIRDGGNCEGDEEIQLLYGFSKENVTADSFDVFVDGVWQATKEFDAFGVDNYDATFLTTPGIRQLTICVQGDAECCVTTSFVVPNCGSTPNCAFDNIIATTHSCQEDGRFFVDIAFETVTPLSDSFRILDHELSYGTFKYGESFYTIGPVENISDKRYEFILQDLENETCLDFTVVSVTNFCKSSFVWPGDTNFDNIVDNFDLANISLIFGTTGPSRNAISIEFDAKVAPDWDGQFANGLNYKHADCNGDGIINEADVEAISNNYDFDHGDVPAKLETNEDENAPVLFVDFPEISIDQKGQTITSPLIFGTNDLPATAYGLAFRAVFDPDLLRNGDIIFTDNWLGTTADDLLIVNQNMSTNGIVEVAISKKDTTNSIGDGSIGNFIVIIDNIEGYTGGGTISLENVQILDKSGTSLAVHAPPTEIIINPIVSNDNLIEIVSAIRIYPNPVEEWLNLEFTLAEKIEAIYIRNIAGQVVKSLATEKTLLIPTTTLVDGIYFLEVQTPKGSYYKKFFKE